MQIGSLPPRPSPREAGGGRGGEERGRGRGPGRGRRGARKRGETGPRRRRPVRERLGASAARQAASCAPGPRACCCCWCCCCYCCCRRCRYCCCHCRCRRCPPPASAPAAPASSGRRARPAPPGARPRRRWASSRVQGPSRLAAGYRAPESRIPTQGADLAAAAAVRPAPRAAFFGGCSASPGGKVHLFFSRPAANPRPALSGRDQSERSAEGERPGSPLSRRLRLRAAAAARESNSSELRRRRREPGAGGARGVRGGCCRTRRRGNPTDRKSVV